MSKKTPQTRNTKKSSKFEKQSWTVPNIPPEARPVNVPPPQPNKPESPKPEAKPESSKPEANKPKK